MPRYCIKVNESWVNQCWVDADSPGEAIEKMLAHDTDVSFDDADFYCYDREQGMPIKGNEALADELAAHNCEYVDREEGYIPRINSIEVVDDEDGPIVE